jgi:hypothetical protein
MKFAQENELELVTFLAHTKLLLQTLSGLETGWVKRVREFLHVNGRNENKR